MISSCVLFSGLYGVGLGKRRGVDRGGNAVPTVTLNKGYRSEAEEEPGSDMALRTDDQIV